MANLRYRNARNAADLLGQVFTPYPIASLLADSIPANCQPVRCILDLGAGKGVLAAAILERHKRAKAVLIEIDGEYALALDKLMPERAIVIHADVLGRSWENIESPDVIVSNPPYGTIAASMDVTDMLKLSGLKIEIHGSWVRSDVAFFARAWDNAKRGCNLGLIVASPMIRDNAYQNLRKQIVREISDLCVTQLHEATFQNAEVRAFLITGKRAVSRRRNVLLRKALADGSIIDEMAIDYHTAVKSLDIDYHRALERLGISASHNFDTLGSIGAVISRGSRSLRDYERLGMVAFHTTNFSDFEDEVNLFGASDRFKVARPGDILIPRVGTRCLARQTRVRYGSGLFTDCVYRLTIKHSARTRVWKTLTSPFGTEWRIANAGGSCAKHLTVQTLLGMPVF